MDSVVITLRYDQKEVDLELPVNVPFFLLTSILIEKLEWPAPEGEQIFFTGRALHSGVVVRPSETLGQAGIADGDVLELAVTSAGAISAEAPVAPGSTAYLQCVQTGRVFLLRGRATLVGRARTCAISLAGLPGSQAVSRVHANIVRRADGYWIKDQRSTNGTIVDGYLLQAGESVRLRAESHVQFGEDGPLLVFRLGAGS